MDVNKSYRSWIFVVCFVAFMPLFAEAQIMFMDKPVIDIVLDLTKFLLRITGGIALFVLMISGIMYMLSAGNVDSKNKAKKALVAALAGLFLVLISYAIMVVIENIFVKP
ncbi:MAG: hypothetical protein WC788_09570 [Candidatus Paceibacterota bacterium]